MQQPHRDCGCENAYLLPRYLSSYSTPTVRTMRICRHAMCFVTGSALRQCRLSHNVTHCSRTLSRCIAIALRSAINPSSVSFWKTQVDASIDALTKPQNLMLHCICTASKRITPDHEFPPILVAAGLFIVFRFRHTGAFSSRYLADPLLALLIRLPSVGSCITKHQALLPLALHGTSNLDTSTSHAIPRFCWSNVHIVRRCGDLWP
jgi:hypothetical protein